jgi:hypothetical protein
MANTGMLEMGRKKRQDEDAKSGIAIRGSKEWRDWVMALAKFKRLKATDLIDQALIEYARNHHFEPPAPER